MALQRTRHASIFVGGKKVGEMFKNKEDITTGSEPLIGDAGWEGMTEGAITQVLDFDVFVPVAGASFDPRTALLQQQDVDITVGPISGKLHQQTGRFTKATYDSDAKTGALNGSFSLMAGPPTVV